MKKSAPRRNKHPPVSDQMKAWSAALAVEVADWPRATARSFFGFNALYRGDNIAAVLRTSWSICRSKRTLSMTNHMRPAAPRKTM